MTNGVSRRPAAMVLALALATACGPTTPTPVPGPEVTVTTRTPPIRVMTWNLQRGQALAGRVEAADMAPFAALVAASRADVVGLQEVTRDEADAIGRALGWPRPAYVETKRPCPDFPPPLPATCVPFGNAILSRYSQGPAEHWALPASRGEESREDRVLLRSVVDADGRALPVYVTHLASNATRSEREAQATAVLARVDERDSGPSVLVGDFNAAPTDDVVAIITDRFVDAWDVGPDDDGEGDGFTSNAVLGLRRRIDYVFIRRDRGLRVTDAEVVAEVLSDHLAVVAEISWDGA
jgi:endonuclease/exonuclease/phosphatase family metal-dependent hydrolase